MKSEDHFIHLVVATLLQFVMLGAGTTFSPRGGDYPLSSYLTADITCGLSLLFVIACLSRGYLAAKIGAVILCILPAMHIYRSITNNLPIFIHEWQNP